MQASDIPAYKLNYTWAVNAAGGDIQYPIPDSTSTPGRASLKVGFPDINFQPTGSGGIPPFGKDVNGGLAMISSWIRWALAGNAFLPYDSTFQTTIGGYPKGAIVLDTNNPNSNGIFWISLTDNNTQALGGSNWSVPGTILPYYGLDTGGGGANAVQVTDLPQGALPAGSGSTPYDAIYGRLLTIKKASGANTGACTMSLQGNSGLVPARPLVRANGSALSSGDLPLGCWFTCVWDGSTGSNSFMLTKGSA